MSLPTYDELTLPLLQLAAKDSQEYAVGSLRKQLVHQLQLTPEQLAKKLPSGRQAVFNNRVGWATTHLRKAKLLESTRFGYVKITQRGQDVIADNPSVINSSYLKRFEEYRNFTGRATPDDNDRQTTDDTSIKDKSTPDESIREGVSVIEANLRDDLIEKILTMDPSDFEWLVLQLLHAMGYGGSIKDVEGVPRGPDGGIDGLIKEDKLGLDAIYIQTKRYQLNNNIGREKIQAFQGALAGIGARKGVFITTSNFTQQAQTYVERLRDSKVILINGQKLAQLMIEHDIGVSIQETFHIKRIDEDFFDETKL